MLNLGSGVGSSVLEVVAAAERPIGRPVPHEAVARRRGEPEALYADTERAKDVLGWTARLGLDEILSSAWAWHSNHLDGYAD